MQPVGRGIGPALEAMDVLAVLRNEPDAPADLRERAITIASALLKLSGKYHPGTETNVVRSILESGEAYGKFVAICKTQGNFREPKYARYRFDIPSGRAGTVLSVDNRKLARIAKLAGAPQSPSAGVLYNAPIGRKVKKGDILFTIYSESEGELTYSRNYLESLDDLLEIK
jgi:thymidine phosphorylase